MALRRKAVILLGITMLLLSGGAAAVAVVATSSAGSTGLIHGCYAAKAVAGSHILVLQNAGTSCPVGSVPIFWNASRPPGPSEQPGLSSMAYSVSSANELNSLDELNGTPCNNGAGKLQVQYQPGGPVTLTCAVDTKYISLGLLKCPGANTKATGANTAGTATAFTFDGKDAGNCTVTVSLAGNNTGDSFVVWAPVGGRLLTPSSGIPEGESFTFPQGPDLPVIVVSGGRSDLPFTLTVTSH